jgi:hypothetical protein
LTVRESTGFAYPPETSPASGRGSAFAEYRSSTY